MTLEDRAFAPLKPTKFRGRALAEADLNRLVAFVAARPDDTLEQIREAMRTSAGPDDDLARVQPVRAHVQKKTVHAHSLPSGRPSAEFRSRHRAHGRSVDAVYASRVSELRPTLRISARCTDMKNALAGY